MPSVDPGRRRLLATAGLGAVAGAGGGYVVGARPFAEEERDPPTPLAYDPAAWPFPDYDRGRTRSVPAASAPAAIAAPGSLTERWRETHGHDRRLGDPVIANGHVHLSVVDTDGNRTTVAARSLGDGRTGWTWRVENGGFDETSLAALGDAVFCATNRTRGKTVVTLAAATGEERWRHARDGQGALPSLLVTRGQLLLADPTGGGRVRALDARTGEPVWSTREVGELASSPVFDGERVVLAERGGLRALDPATGETVWTAPVESETQTDGVVWGPVVAGDRIVVGTHLGALAAFDAVTGDRQWRRDLADPVPCGDNTCARWFGAGAASPTRVLAVEERFDGTPDRLHCREAESGAAVWTVTDAHLPGGVRLSAPVSVQGEASGDRGATVLVGEGGDRDRESSGAVVAYERDTGDRLGVREFPAGVAGVAVASGRVLVRTWDSFVVLG